jgi:hypothetical protein
MACCRNQLPHVHYFHKTSGIFPDQGGINFPIILIEGVVSGKRRDSFMGEEVLLHDEKKAEELFEFGLKVCGITEADLPCLKKGDERKKAIAWLIRKKTSVRVAWITSRLKMGTTSNFARYVRAVEQSKEGFLQELKNKMTN